MAEYKTMPSTTSAPAFLDACADEARRTDAKAPTKLMQKATGNSLRCAELEGEGREANPHH